MALIKISQGSFQLFFERLKDTSDRGKWCGTAEEVGRLGANADPAIPLLLAAFQHTNDRILCLAASDRRPAPSAARPLPGAAGLAAQFDEQPSPEARAGALGSFGPAAKPVAPEIARCLNDRDPWVRTEATNALRLIDLEAPGAEGETIMTFLPIVGRELRVAARRRLTYWGRALFALLAIVIGVFVYLANYRSGPLSFAERLFGTLIWLATFYCLFSGIGFTADSLSEEKREGTLGLLFLTDLRGYDVILGKLAATSMSGFYAILALFPMLAVPLLLGGVTVGEFWRVVLVLVLTALFSLAAAILVSALSRSRRKARAGAFFLLLLFGAGFPAAAGLILALDPVASERPGRALAPALPVLCHGPGGRRLLSDWDAAFLVVGRGDSRADLAVPVAGGAGRASLVAGPPGGGAGTALARGAGGTGSMAMPGNASRSARGCSASIPSAGWPAGPASSRSWSGPLLPLWRDFGPGVARAPGASGTTRASIFRPPFS